MKEVTSSTELEALANMVSGTFRIRIKGRQNATWQGTVIWTDTGEMKSFRSAMELMKLIDSTLDVQD